MLERSVGESCVGTSWLFIVRTYGTQRHGLREMLIVVSSLLVHVKGNYLAENYRLLRLTAISRAIG
jgi:hypothetical protein